MFYSPDKTGHQGILDSADKDICQKKTTQIIAHWNMPLTHHEMTKLIMFRGTRKGNCGYFKETCYYDVTAILL